MSTHFTMLHALFTTAALSGFVTASLNIPVIITIAELLSFPIGIPFSSLVAIQVYMPSNTPMIFGIFKVPGVLKSTPKVTNSAALVSSLNQM